MPLAPEPTALQSLESLVHTAGALVKQLQDILLEIRNNPEKLGSSTTASTSTSPQSTSTTPLDALALARDSASLVKAHATKISLLIINEPFTPSAIASVIREIVAGPIPDLAASLQACEPNLYTAVFRRELAWCCHRVLSELHDLLQKIPKNGKILAKEDEGFGAQGKGSIASTGVLWSACDGVVSLANGGVGGFFLQKMKEWKDTLNDIMEELKEWGDEEPDDEDEEEEEEEEDDDDDEIGSQTDDLDQAGANNASTTQNMLDDLMSSQRSIPLSDPDRIRPRLESSLRRLRLVNLLYQAVTKRRIKKLPPFPQTDAGAKVVPQRLDEIATVLQKLPDRFGDLACAFYELRPGEIDDAMDQCFLDAFAVSELLAKSWDGSRDEFTEWTDKFQLEIKKA